MRITNILIAGLTLAAAPAIASPSNDVPEGAPAASPNALYCLRIEPEIGSRLETVQCFTREQWAGFEVDLDKDWATDGVRVIDSGNG